MTAISPQPDGHVPSQSRLRLTIRGVVQGVGFRPFIYRLATEGGLRGWVNNSSQGVFVEVEGSEPQLRKFLLRIEAEKPPRAFIRSLEATFLDEAGYQTFEIRPSDDAGAKTALVLPDVATCLDCLADVTDPTNRRYLYPFTNCTNCGPRFSIIEALPYDRPNTTMKRFPMCAACRAEYENPLDRRFHAQPTACPACGPHLEWWTAQGDALASDHIALIAAAEAIRGGGIVAIKGLGGFQLLVDARNAAAVGRLRARKQREEKPFALMASSLNWIESCCEVADLERRLLLSPESPIVLLKKREGAGRLPLGAVLASDIAPGNPYLGVMLPYTPLHHILMMELGFPVIATSGNLSDEPICIDEREALNRLRGIADGFLVHNRPIARHVDDSIVRVMMNREMVLRRARGYAPLPVTPVRGEVPPPNASANDDADAGTAPLIAVGAHLKNAVAASTGNDVFISQHIGDLETTQALDAFKEVIESFKQLYELNPSALVCDLHPDYLSTQYARASGLPVIAVQHHYAHVLSCMAENRLRAPVLGIAWDGSGMGIDGTVWGGEFLRVGHLEHGPGCACLAQSDGEPFQRVAHLKTFALPGGDRAAREPRRAAIGVLYEIFGDALFERDDLAPVRAFSAAERAVLKTMLARNLNVPVTSSAGRLFDAVAAILGLRQISRFEGQAAMALEFAIEGIATDDYYDFQQSAIRNPDNPQSAIRNPQSDGPQSVIRESAIVIDWAPMIRSIIGDVARALPPPAIAARFHNTLCEMIVAVAQRIGDERVALSGGCFQNRYLTERAVTRLQAEGFRVYWHQRVPPNDGGIALGQVVAAKRTLQ